VYINCLFPMTAIIRYHNLGSLKKKICRLPVLDGRRWKCRIKASRGPFSPRNLWGNLSLPLPGQKSLEFLGLSMHHSSPSSSHGVLPGFRFT
jgi:hypothetical protein